MQTLVAATLLLACIQVCTVQAIIDLPPEAQAAYIEECTALGTSTHCNLGLAALETLDTDPNHYLDTMGFYVPSRRVRNGYFNSVFWSTYELKDSLCETLKVLKKLDHSLWSAENIFPGGVTNRLYGNKQFPTEDVFSVPQFWIPFSEWMAKHTEGLAFYLSGSERGFFPRPGAGERKKVFEEFELPNLDSNVVSGLIALHLPPKDANAPSCANDQDSVDHLKEVNNKLKYYCCNLPNFISADKSAQLMKTLANRVVTAIEQGWQLPESCIAYN